MNKTICLDFDGVIHSYQQKFTTPETIPDPPVPGAFDFINECLDHGYLVAVFSTRSKTESGVRAMIQWFKDNGCKDTEFISFPTDKPMAILYIDDRAFEFRGVFPRMEWLDRFKPWNKQ